MTVKSKHLHLNTHNARTPPYFCYNSKPPDIIVRVLTLKSKLLTHSLSLYSFKTKVLVLWVWGFLNFISCFSVLPRGTPESTEFHHKSTSSTFPRTPDKRTCLISGYSKAIFNSPSLRFLGREVNAR